MKINLEIIERIAVIIGSFLGLIAFFRQLYDSYDVKKEKIKAEVYFDFVYSENNEKLQELNALINIVNVGQKPIHIRRIYIFEDKTVMAEFNYRAIDIQTEAIEAGANRTYHLNNIKYSRLEDIQRRRSRVVLIIDSNKSELLRKSIKKCIAEIVASENHRIETSSKYGTITRTRCY